MSFPGGVQTSQRWNCRTKKRLSRRMAERNGRNGRIEVYYILIACVRRRWCRCPGEIQKDQHGSVVPDWDRSSMVNRFGAVEQWMIERAVDSKVLPCVWNMYAACNSDRFHGWIDKVRRIIFMMHDVEEGCQITDTYCLCRLWGIHHAMMGFSA